MQVDVVDIEGRKVGTVDLPDDVFGVEINLSLLWEQVKAQRASWRAGTHATKTRAEVRGGGTKPYKQKGTGRARQGSIRAPNHVGGGVVFGPQPRDYAYRLPRGARKSALRSALSQRAKEKKLVIVDKFAMSGPKTKAAVERLSKLGAAQALVVDVENDALKLSIRNMPRAQFLDATAINVYAILRHPALVVTKAAVDAITKKARAREAA